jgi:ribose/xylose/arabinose/galactoside ABC-type transport system permease subunit
MSNETATVSVKKDEYKTTDYSSLMKKLLMPTLMVVFIIFFSIQAPDSFLTWYNIKNILAQSSYVIIAGVGLSFIIISGGIDLSIGYQMSLSGVIAAIAVVNMGFSTGTGILICLLVGLLLGLFNGILCTKLNVNPLIITLSAAMMYQGVSYMISKSNTIIGFPKSFLFIGQGYIGVVPFPVILATIIVLIAIFVLKKTYFGRYIYAIGGNEEAAKLSGINTDKMKIILFGICGVCSAIAAIVLMSRSGAANSSIGPGTEFTALSGCLLGGIALNGGEGTITGMVVGAFIISILANGMQLMYLGVYPQYIAKGVVLIAAMAFDVYQKNRKGK